MNQERECPDCGHCRDCGYFHEGKKCPDPNPNYDGTCLCHPASNLDEALARLGKCKGYPADHPLACLPGECMHLGKVVTFKSHDDPMGEVND